MYNPSSYARSSASLAALLLSVSLPGGKAYPADTARNIAVAVGASEILRTPPGVGTIVLGNPDIADASVVNATTIAITGKAQGGTNLILLDAGGREMSRTMLQVGSRKIQVVVFGGSRSQIYSCAPNCVALPGDAPAGAAPAMATYPAPPDLPSPAGVSTETGIPQ